MVLRVALHTSEREGLWSTSISVTCQDLWEMESKPDRSESLLLKPTPGPLWDVMDENPCHTTPTSPHSFLHSLLLPPLSSPTLCPSWLVFVIHSNLMEIWLPKFNEADSLKEISKCVCTQIHSHGHKHTIHCCV